MLSRAYLPFLIATALTAGCFPETERGQADLEKHADAVGDVLPEALAPQKPARQPEVQPALPSYR